MVAPFSGWADINSFLDHDNPDYQIDGTIVIANGLTANQSDGAASDYFPAYWSDSLRQYLNYDGHNGYDFGISYQPVLAAADGTVRYAGWNGSSPYEGYGLMVLIDHHNGYITLYGHLSHLDIKSGETVAAGQQIGISGSTGHSSGPHLHFSVFHNCQVTDPYGWTGNGTDPLYTFDEEHAQYLWLPGQEPLVLNPPPNWPTFPLGLKVPVPSRSTARIAGRSLSFSLAHSRRIIPPADRLLLLHLPAVHAAEHVTPSVALARTEGLVTQEGETVTPYLDALQTQGLVQSYQIVPAAAAVWVRGTATGIQLEGLPGVASLAGGQPRDLEAAQVGLAHSILIQMGPEKAPSLWPVGFRSALQAWQPTIAVTTGHSLVAGFALPGQHVVVALHRGNSVPGAAAAYADPETGGFAAMIHGVSGTPVDTRAGDRIEIRSGNRTAEVTLLALQMKARSHYISGQSVAGAEVPIALMVGPGDRPYRRVTVASATGRFQVNPASRLTPGTLAVASVVDAAGDQESTSAFVPGLVVNEGNSTIHGWTVSDSPQLLVLRSGRVAFYRRLRPAPDGSFQIDLVRHGHPMKIRAGDVIRIGSRWHPRQFTVPRLHASLSMDSSSVTVMGPPRNTLEVLCRRATGESWSRRVHLDGRGQGTVSWPDSSTGIGDSVTVVHATATGDIVQATGQARGIIVNESAGTVTGQVRAAAALRIDASTPSGQLLAGAVVTSDRTEGRFSAQLLDAYGHAVHLGGSTQLDVQDGLTTTSVGLPSLSLHKQANGVMVNVSSLHRTRAMLTILDSQGQSIVRTLYPDKSGRVSRWLSWAHIGTAVSRVSLDVHLTEGFTVEQDLLVRSVAPTVRRGRSRSTGSGVPAVHSAQ